MLRLCCNYRMTIFTINFTTEDIKNLVDFSSSGHKSDLSKMHQAMGRGKHWYYIPHLRLFMSECDVPDKSVKFSNKRFLQIWHSKFLKAKTGCIVEISDAGIV